MPKKIIAFRVDPEVAEWTLNGGDRTAFFEELIRAYRERRMIIAARPAPDTIIDGQSDPIFVDLTNHRE